MAKQQTAKVAFVTGASRGIGKAIAIELADAGYDVAILARTVHEGETREHSSTFSRSDTTPLPGSLEGTAELIRARGRRALVVPGDLLDHPSLVDGVATVLHEWGRVDVLVNNGRYVGPGHMDRIVDTPVRVLRDHLEANSLAPVVLIKAVLPQMLERGDGTIINITSGVAYEDPPAPAGEGGWGLGYAISKGAVHRIAGVLAVEHRASGVRAYSVQPGFIATERIAQDMAAFGFDAATGAPAAVVGKACRWLLESPDARARNGQCIQAQQLCSERGLLPGWSLAAGPDLVGSERDVLLHYLNKNRNAVVRTSEGLGDEQQRAPGVPSGTNLLGIVQHLTGVEQHWFRLVFQGVDLEIDDSMAVPAGATREQVVTAYREACARSDEIVRACPDLSTLAAIANPGEDGLDSLRRIIAHMIEETARHAGQADIVREQIDGVTED